MVTSLCGMVAASSGESIKRSTLIPDFEILSYQYKYSPRTHNNVLMHTSRYANPISYMVHIYGTKCHLTFS